MATTLDTLLRTDPEVQELALTILRECTDLREFGARCLEAMLNSLMSAQADEACGAPYRERSEARTNSRNGYRERGLETSAGDVTLEVPKLRHGSYYPEELIERYTRADRALVACVVEMYANGVSTRKVRRVAEELGVDSLSRSQVSRMCSALDGEVSALRSSRLEGHAFRYLWVDATYVRCRVSGRSVSVAVVTAIGLDEGGHKRFVGLDVVDTESRADWVRFLRSLRERGLSGVLLVVSDAHTGIVSAVEEVMQGAAWQRCVTHLTRNAADAVSGDLRQRLVRECLKATWAQSDPTLVRACYQRSVDALAGEAGCLPAAELLADAEESALAYLAFPPAHAKKIRTNNVQERANREIKRRTRVVQSFPSAESLLRLVGAVLIEENDAWQLQRVFSVASTASADGYEAPVPSEAERASAAAQARRIIDGALEAARSRR